MHRSTENGFSLTDEVAAQMDGGLGWLYKTAGMQHILLVIHHLLTHPLIFAPHIHTDVILSLMSNLAIPTQHTFWTRPVPVSILCAHA